MTELILNHRQYLEVEKLGFGALAPLNGFMNEDEFHSVVNDMRLTNGDVYPLPVVLDISKDDADRLRGSDAVTLVYDGQEVGTMHPESFFTCDRQDVSKKIFDTDEMAHPGVAMFHQMAEVFVGGKILLTHRARHSLSDHELTPDETKAIFKERGWERVAGFQTRNVPHRAHEYLQRVALEHTDGLFVQPLVGWKKRGDYTAEAVLTGYQALIDGFYPKDKVLLGVLTTFMRYSGPREAVFHALIRRNYGCTHFIVGRDHAGVGDYYGKYAAHDLTRRFDGELGIQVMRLHGPYYCEKCDGMVTEHTCPHLVDAPEFTTQISGTDMRAILSGGKEPEDHIMRQEVVASLRGTALFIEETDI